MRLLWKPTYMSFDFKIPKMEPSGGIQKAGGFSRGWHHNNSNRCGIHRENDNYILFLYAYVKGERIEQRLKREYKEGEKVNCILRWMEHFVSIKTDFDFEIYRFEPFTPCNLGYRLNSYAEEDFTQKEIPFNIKLNNVVIK
jgi:hypothetical protein